LFRLSTKSSYGLRACLALACSSGAGPLAVADLSRDNQIPRRYLEQILNALRHKGLVSSTRGARGGYKLSRDPGAISVGEIVRAVEGEMDPILCSVPELQSHDCRTTLGCASRRLCHDLETTLLTVLDGTTLEDMRREAVSLHPGESAVQFTLTLPLQAPQRTNQSKIEVNYV
jgi:Rrf2 family transcriptional regulator, cysteine metabolism repressor